MEPLFLFGTLQHRPLIEAVLGHIDKLSFVRAELQGHEVCLVAEGPFPTILAVEGRAANGLLVHGLCEEDIARLDFYESIFGYERRPIVLPDGQAAQAYFPPASAWTPGGTWDVAAWARDWGQISVMAAEEVMNLRNQKSPAEIAVLFPIIRARAWSALNARGSRHGALTMRGAVEVQQMRRPYMNYFAVDEYDIRHEKFDGRMTDVVSRAVFRAPDAALVLPYDPHRDAVLLVEQVRMGPFARGDEKIWQLEPVAGRLDAGESPEEAARREAKEEAGLDIGELTSVAEVYCSPGNSSEFYYIFVGIADLPPETVSVGGLEEENEDIRSHIIPFGQLMDMCDGLDIANAPLVMAAYWLSRHRGTLRATAGVR